MKKKIDISGIDSLSLLGVRDINIKTLQERVNAQIIVRGSDMQLDGTKNEIQIIESVISEMMLTINNKGFVDPEEILSHFESISNSQVINNISDDNPIIPTHKPLINK